MPFPEDQALPEGISWYSGPRRGRLAALQFFGVLQTYTLDEDTWIAAFTRFMAWLSENGLRAAVYSDAPASGGGTLPTHFYVDDPDEQIRQMSIDHNVVNPRWVQEGWTEQVVCGLCHAEHLDGYHSCPSYSFSPRCRQCGWQSWEDITFLSGPFDAEIVCSNCTVSCEECSRLVRPSFVFCSDHADVQGICSYCQDTIEVVNEDDFRGTVVGDSLYCETCAVSSCAGCRHVFPEDELSLTGDGLYCESCLPRSMQEERDENAVMRPEHLRIRTIPGREQIRMCGIEIEGGNGSLDGHALASSLYEDDLSQYSEMTGYHYGRAGFAHVERDSSVDWEVVIGPVNMADPTHVRQLNTTVRKVRSMVHDGDLKLDLRCGLHIHIGAEGVSLDGAFNLNVLFAYLEDPIYRLAAAHWPMHRALSGSHYASPVPKGVKSKVEFGRVIHDAERYCALSFNNYINAMLNNCRCGAVRYDAWSECTCELGKCTFEFRVFNTTANPKKLHAYLALTQALVAKALSMSPDERESFTAMEFVPEQFKNLAAQEQTNMLSRWDERLVWLFNELPLTDQERESLHYTAMNSELASLGDTRLTEIAGLSIQTKIEEVLA